MPRLRLPKDTQDLIRAWLKKELEEHSSITPHLDCVPESLREVKGIYLWFMKEPGYTSLSKFVPITPVLPVLQMTLKEEEYHLVYLGSAGASQSSGDLYSRLNWHIHDKHKPSAVNSGFLSTLRKGIGSLLADHLIEPDTEQVVNAFMQSFMKIFWISYYGRHDKIETDESVLIGNLRPLLNIKHNPNSYLSAPLNSTQNYGKRRIHVLDSCRSGLNKIANKNPSQMMKLNFPSEGEKSPMEASIIPEEGSFKFTVSVDQNIAEVISNIQGLPTGLVHFRMYDQANPSHLVFPGWKKTGTSKQNIYSYFKNTGGKALRYQMISEYMKVNKIDRIVLEIWDANHESTVVKQEPTTVKTNPDIKPVSFQDEKPKQDGGFKVVIICASRKNGNQLQSNGNRVYFRAVPDHSNNVFLPDDKMPESNMTWRDAIVNLQDHSTFSLKSYQLYGHPVYKALYKKFGRDLYILSAGWGMQTLNCQIMT